MFNIDKSTAQKIIKSFQIPVKPQILVEIQQELAKQEPSPNAFAEVIVKDVGLSSAVLKTINSPIFGLNRTITDIKQSVMMLGFNNISNLVSFFELKKAFDNKSSISHEDYWERAMGTANVMTLLIESLGLKNNCPLEDAYAFGLFMDCGIPLMAMKYTDYRTVFNEASNSSEVAFTQIEEGYYQANHANIGYFVATSWNLPKNLCQLILRHHEFDFLEASDISTEQKDLYALAKLASNILSQHYQLKDDCEWNLVKESVLGHLGLSQIDYNDIEEDIKEAYKIQFG